MAAPLILERLGHLSALYSKCSSFNRYFAVSCAHKFTSFGNTTGSVEVLTGRPDKQHNLSTFKSPWATSSTKSDLPRCIHFHNSSSQTCHRLVIAQQFLFTKDADINLHVGQQMSTPWLLIQCRHYGRKMKPKPPRITHFEYSGDLRTLPEIETEVLLYPYVDLEGEMDENIKKMTSFEFASVVEERRLFRLYKIFDSRKCLCSILAAPHLEGKMDLHLVTVKTQQNKHLKQLVEDRIIELFGPDSELEQEIAKKTLRIRQMIPYCIRMRVDKGNKIWLLKTIFRRRRLLNQLRQMDYERFEWLLRELKIRYVIPRDREEFKGWKHNVREASKEETLMEKRRKLDELRQKVQSEKEAFIQQKAKIIAEIEKDLESFGLDKDYLDSVQVKERFRKKPHKILTWDERVKLGMTGKIKDYYG